MMMQANGYMPEQFDMRFLVASERVSVLGSIPASDTPPKNVIVDSF